VILNRLATAFLVLDVPDGPGMGRRI